VLSLRFRESAFAVRDITPVEPVRVSATAHFEVAIEPLPDRVDERIVQVGLSVSFSDDPTVIELRDNGLEGDEDGDDGLFVGAFPVPEHTVAGAYPLHAWVEDDGGATSIHLGACWKCTLRSSRQRSRNKTMPACQINPSCCRSIRTHSTATRSSASRWRSRQPLIWASTTWPANGWPPSSHGERQAGHHLVSWDGRDDDKRPLASGVYLYRLDTGGTHLLKKLILIR